MKLRGKIRITADIITKNFMLPILLFSVCFIAAYMLDTVMTDYFYRVSLLKQCESPFKEDYNNVYYINYTSYNDEAAKASVKLKKEMKNIKNIQCSGIFTGAGTPFENFEENVEAVIVDTSIIGIGNLGISETQIKELLEYRGEYYPVMVGYEFREELPVGTVFSYFGEEDECVVIGILPKDSKWIVRGGIKESYVNSFVTDMNDRLLICVQDNGRELGGIFSQEYIYFTCTPENRREVYNAIYDKAIELECPIMIQSVGDMIEEIKENNGLADNKEFLAAVMLVIIAVISLSTAAIVVCLLRRNDFGIMYAFGISIGEIGQIIVMENFLVIFLAVVTAWFVRCGEIFNHDIAIFTKLTQIQSTAWNWSHNVMVPLVLAGCGLLIFLFSSVIPLLMLRKENPVNLINKKD